MTFIPVLLILAASPNYYNDIEPILAANCNICHSNGQVAPFTLTSYNDAKKHARLIAAVTASHRMPIWKPEPGIVGFQDERRLSAAQIATLGQWAKAGAPEGKPSPAQKAKVEVSQQSPDLVLQMPAPIQIPADGPDQFLCAVISIPITENKWVSKVEFEPGNPKIVHHSLFFLVDEKKALRQSGTRGYYTCFGGPGGIPQGALGGWAPGAFPRELPSGSARQLKKGLALVMQQHYHPSGKSEQDQSTLNVFFAKGPVERQVNGFAVRTRDIHIPAGAASHLIKASLEIPVPVTLLGTTPHMHYIGKAMKATAVLPSGQVISLISIRDWDFKWQGQYRFAKPIDLPAGTRIDMEAVYDNSDSNPHNPNTPPKPVEWGEQTTNEMAICFFEYTSSAEGAQRRILFSMAKQFVVDLF